jgi:ribosomal protein S15P/S13E
MPERLKISSSSRFKVAYTSAHSFRDTKFYIDPDRPAAQRADEWSEREEARNPKKREKHRLRVSIGVSGWLNSPSDVNRPWEVMDATGTEPFSLRFELDAMLRLGNSLNDVLYSYAWDGVTYSVVSSTLLGALYAGLWPLGLVKVASVLDNPFSVALARADKAGKVMARALIDKVQGERPVTLIAYSVGARVIYSCLVELAEQHAFGLVESIILMGAPVPSDSYTWRQIRSVVSARVVNVYSTEDYILGFLYRSTKLQIGVAGLQEVRDIYGIENVDMSKLVTGHDRYRFLIGTILMKVGFGDVAFNKVAEQERALELMERKKQQVREHVKRHKKDRQQEDPSAADATELIVAHGNDSTNLVEASTSTPKRISPLPAQRQLVMPSRGSQQPVMQRQMTVPQRYQEEAPASHLDPLSGSIATETRPSISSRPATFPVASRSHNPQAPTNMVPTPAAQPQPTNLTVPTRSENVDDHLIVMKDIDSQKFSPPLEGMLRFSPATIPRPVLDSTTAPAWPNTQSQAVAMTPADSVNRDVHDGENSSVYESGNETDEHELNSEFGDLSMVDPVPLDD